MSETWWPVDEAVRQRAPHTLWPWLTETGSLTQKLKSRCIGEFELVVVSERDVTIDAAEARLLQLDPGAPALERRVKLCCDGRPCIEARSLLPHRTLAGSGAELAQLGNRPLGDALFAHPMMERSAIEITDTPCWGRRSVFRLAGEPVLVSEFFLPALHQCTA